MYTIAVILRLQYFNKQHILVLSSFVEMKFVKYLF